MFSSISRIRKAFLLLFLSLELKCCFSTQRLPCVFFKNSTLMLVKHLILRWAPSASKWQIWCCYSVFEQTCCALVDSEGFLRLRLFHVQELIAVVQCYLSLRQSSDWPVLNLAKRCWLLEILEGLSDLPSLLGCRGCSSCNSYIVYEQPGGEKTHIYIYIERERERERVYCIVAVCFHFKHMDVMSIW